MLSTRTRIPVSAFTVRALAGGAPCYLHHLRRLRRLLGQRLLPRAASASAPHGLLMPPGHHPKFHWSGPIYIWLTVRYNSWERGTGM